MRAAAAIALLLLAGCDHDGPGVRQTKAPGHIMAGGQSSGAVMAAAAGPVQPGPAGTPGIPKGAEGNTGGAALGGTTSAQAPRPTGPGGVPTAPASGAAAAAASATTASAAAMPASAPALSDAQRQQVALEAVQDTVAARWRSRPHPPQQAAMQATAASAPVLVKSEKLGTAAPSPDVKTPTKPPTYPVVDPKSPEAAGAKP